MKICFKHLLTEDGLRNIGFLLFALVSGLNVTAQNKEATTLELGVEYRGAEFKSAYFVFTATQDSKLVTLGNIQPVLYTDLTYTNVLQCDATNSYVGGQKEMQVSVKSGVTYYLGIDFPLDAWYFTANYADTGKIELVSVLPEVNKTFPLGDGGFIQIQFDTPISIGKSYLQIGATVVEVSGMTYGKDISFEVKEQLMSWLKSGVMKSGDTFTLTIENVVSASNPSVLYNGDGKLVLSWTASVKPAEVVNETYPEVFLSYWPADAEDGLLILEYDTELSTEKHPTANLSFGSAEVEGDYYSEDLNVKIEGKTLTIDFRDKLRIPAKMVASGTDYGFINVRVNNIFSADGEYVYSSGKGTFGSYQNQFVYEQLTEELTTEFTPESGSSLVGVNSVELWLSNPDAVSFDGVNISYKSAAGIDESVNYTNEQCNYNNAGLDGITLDIPITEDMQKGSNVTITLTNLVSLDGLNREIKAVYNPVVGFNPVSIVPTNQSTIMSLDMITLTYDCDVTVLENTGAIVYKDNGRTEVAKLEIKTSMSNSVCLVAETPITEVAKYTVVIPAGSIGNAAGDKNEEIVLEYEVIPNTSGVYMFTPSVGTTVESLSKITVEYTDGFGVSWNYDATLTNAEGNVVAKVFTDGGIEEVWPENFEDPITTVILTLQDPTSKTAITITTPGTYTLLIPKGFFNIGTGFDTTDSEELTVTYVIGQSGINDLLGEDFSRIEVFTITGVHVLSTTDKSALSKLQSGLYVVNGKKVYLCN